MWSVHKVMYPFSIAAAGQVALNSAHVYYSPVFEVTAGVGQPLPCFREGVLSQKGGVGVSVPQSCEGGRRVATTFIPVASRGPHGVSPCPQV